MNNLFGNNNFYLELQPSFNKEQILKKSVIYLIYFGGSLFRTYGLTAKEFFFVLILASSVIPIDFLRKIYIRKKDYQTNI